MDDRMLAIAFAVMGAAVFVAGAAFVGIAWLIFG